MNIECTIRLVELGSIKALVTVLYGDIELRGFKIVEQGDADFWVAMPSREYQRDGKTEFVHVVRIPDPEKKMAFTDAILAAYKQSLTENPSDSFEVRCL